MQMNRSDLLLRKRNAPEQRQKRGCRGSTELPIVVPRRSWREISCGKLGTLIQQTKNSLNFVSTCLKVVDTRRSQNFVPGATDASDQYGHGTHVAGIIASEGWFSTGSNFTHTFKGIAPNANVINLRVLDQNGAGTDSSVIAAIQTAISLKSTYNIRVINLSLGRQVFESYTLDPLCQAVEAAWSAGIVVVAAAGNQGRNDSAGTEGYGTIAAPGNDPYVITVGAMKTANTPTRTDDTIATYSSKGATAYGYVVKPDIVAPGNQVVSTLAPNAALLGSPTDVFLYEYSNSTTTTTTSGGNTKNNKKNFTSSLSTVATSAIST